jgi:hypothetical protein
MPVCAKIAALLVMKMAQAFSVGLVHPKLANELLQERLGLEKSVLSLVYVLVADMREMKKLSIVPNAKRSRKSIQYILPNTHRTKESAIKIREPAKNVASPDIMKAIIAVTISCAILPKHIVFLDPFMRNCFKSLNLITLFVSTLEYQSSRGKMLVLIISILVLSIQKRYLIWIIWFGVTSGLIAWKAICPIKISSPFVKLLLIVLK